MSEICSVVGARPQFVKAAVVSRALAEWGFEEVLVHTGQHYDPEMSAVFFDELGIKEPVANLDIGSGSHAAQTGEIMVRLEEFLRSRPKPSWLLVYGDTNSTLSAALVGAKLEIPLAHVEAGLRSFNRTMPEEINRVVTDRLSNYLFCPTQTAVDNLQREGVTEGVHLVGDVMLDATLLFAGVADRQRPLETVFPFEAKTYYVATIHRAENTDDPRRLVQIFEGLARVDAPVALPLHPRTRTRLDGICMADNIHLLPPLGYLSMLSLVKHARGVFTDSGGLQKEALWLAVPCITLREETEWIETTEGGWNQIVGADPDRIAAATSITPTSPAPNFSEPGAAERIAAVLGS